MDPAEARIRNLILDMDGVLWQGDQPLPGLIPFFDLLGQLEVNFVLATNNATRTPVQYVDKLARFGVAVAAGRILTSAEATAGYIGRHYPPGTAIYVIGEAGLREALAARGFILAQDEAAIVVAGLDRSVCYEHLARASLLIARGAAFVGTNADPSLPAERGLLPGAGAILAALQATTGVQPVVVGKPGRVLFEEALWRLNGVPAETVMVGDRLTTDIAGGRAAGLRTILLMTGITTPDALEASEVQPDWVFADLIELTAAIQNGLLPVA